MVSKDEVVLQGVLTRSGRWIPSTILPINPGVKSVDLIVREYRDRIPGPSSTLRGFPVRKTGSPTVTPDVSS